MDIIDKFCKYFCENNVDKFLSLFTDNAIYIDCLYGKFSGKDKIKKFYKRCHKEAYNYQFIPKNKIIKEKLAAFEWDFSFISNMPYSKGVEIKVKGCSFLNIQGDKINHYRDYSDSIYFLLQGKVPYGKILEFYKKKYLIEDNIFDKDYIKRETDKLIEIRREFYNFLDKNIQKDKFGIYIFKENPKLDAKKVYELFYKLDYQARKLRGILINIFNLKAE